MIVEGRGSRRGNVHPVRKCLLHRLGRLWHVCRFLFLSHLYLLTRCYHLRIISTVRVHIGRRCLLLLELFLEKALLSHEFDIGLLLGVDSLIKLLLLLVYHVVVVYQVVYGLA